MSNMVDLFCELVRIDSESGEEATLIAHLKKLFEKELQANCVIDDYGNLIAKVSAKGSKKTTPILLGAHADTVKPGNGVEPVVEDGVVRSAGETILGADDKAGIVEILEALRTAKKHPPVEVVITRNEEVGLLGAKNLDRSELKASMGFVLDGDDVDKVVILRGCRCRNYREGRARRNGTGKGNLCNPCCRQGNHKHARRPHRRGDHRQRGHHSRGDDSKRCAGESDTCSRMPQPQP